MPTPFDYCITFNDYQNLLETYTDHVAFLVTAFKKLHSNAPDIDLEKCGGRIAGMWSKKGKDTGYVLKLIWDTASTGIAGSHLDYIQAILFKEKPVRKNLNTGNNGRKDRDPDKYTRGKHGHVVCRGLGSDTCATCPREICPLKKEHAALGAE
jgi:hypothetical protein